MEFTPVYSARYSDDEIRDLFFQAKYPTKKCDFCDSGDVYFVDEARTKLRCKTCWKKSSLTNNTWLDSTKLSLRFWHEVIWSFVLNHPSSKTQKLLRTNNHQTILRIYRTIREAMADRSRRSFAPKKAGNGSGKAKPDSTVKEFADGAVEEDHPVYAVYKIDGELRLKLVDGLRETEEGEDTGTDAFDSATGEVEPIGLGCLFHGRGEYLDKSLNVPLEGLWNFAKNHMQIYQGVRRENWSRYLKEIEFKYNVRNEPYERQVDQIVNLLMSRVE